MSRRFIYSDESGNFDFRLAKDATTYYAIGSVSIDGELDNRVMEAAVNQLRHDLIWEGAGLTGDGFHAGLDNYQTRQRFYALLHTLRFNVDISIIDKSRVDPKLYETQQDFYRYMMWRHLTHVLTTGIDPDDEIVLIAASLGIRKQRVAFHECVTSALAQCAPRNTWKTAAMKDDVMPGLQIADYCLWGIMRDREQGDPTYRPLVPFIRSINDLSADSTHRYY